MSHDAKELVQGSRFWNEDRGGHVRFSTGYDPLGTGEKRAGKGPGIRSSPEWNSLLGAVC